MRLRKLGKILLYIGAGGIGLAGVLLIAVKLALDRVPEYQDEIKEWVHRQIGYRIAFEHVSPAFRWNGPELYFTRFELRSKDDSRVIADAAGGRIGVDVWELIRSGKLFAGRIELEAPQISVTRTASGQFALASEIGLGSPATTVTAAQLDDLPAGTLAIRGGRVTLKDWNEALPVLELRDVNVDLRRGDGIAVLDAAALLPATLGGQIRLEATARGHGRLDELAWTAVAGTHDLGFHGWRDLLPGYLSRLGPGTGGFELSARGAGGNLIRANLDFEVVDFMPQIADEARVKFDRIGGRLTVSHAGDRWTMLGRRLWAQRDGRRDPESEFDASWRVADAGLLEFAASANYLRAETLLPLAGLLPQQDVRERLQEVEPTGEWLNTRVGFTRRSVGDPWQFDVRAQFRGAGFAPVGHAPGVRGLSGSVAGTDRGGRLDLQSRSAVFTWPYELPQPVGLDTVGTTLYWSHTPEELLVATPAIEIRNQDAAVRGRVAWRLAADGDSPELTLAVSVEDGNVADAHFYLPQAHLPPAALSWLSRSLVAGRVPRADIMIHGPIRHFPFRDGTGLFVARLHFEDTTLDYRESWPRAEGMAGIADFRNEGMTLQFLRGRMGELNVASGDARFVDFKTAELSLHASVDGDAADALAYLRATPIDAMADHLFSATGAHGPVEGELSLFLPFKEFDRRRISVHTRLQGISINRLGSDIEATELRGEADVEGAQIVRADVHGRLLGGPFGMQAREPRSAAAPSTLLSLNGTASGDSVRSALSLPPAVMIDGTTEWRAVLKIVPDPERERTLHISTSLAGLDFRLPEPLTKPAGRELPSSVDVSWPAGGATQVRVALGSVVHALLMFKPGSESGELSRATVTFGGAADPAAVGDAQLVNTGGDIERLDLGGWLKLYAPDKNARPIGNFLRDAKFEIGELDYLGLAFTDISLDVAASDSGWRIGVSGPNVVGSLKLPGTESPLPWELEFEQLKFDDAEATGGSVDGASVAGTPSAVNPRVVPAISFHASNVVWGERQLGEVRASLVRLPDGVAVQKLSAAASSFTLDASGDWRGKDAGVARIEGSLTSTDVGATLKQLGYADVIEAKSAKMDFDMAWMGAPTTEALREATGQVRVAIDKGQITGLQPGAGRVLGLASVAALPRRLALDFSDLTDKGFAFDTVRGDFDLRDGSAFTDNVLVKGPAAEIGLIGRVGLKNKDYDQTAVVTGNVGGPLPLAAFVGGPVIGAAVLVFTQVFKQPLKGLARGYYRITGNWDNPTVERIKGADAAAATQEVSK